MLSLKRIMNRLTYLKVISILIVCCIILFITLPADPIQQLKVEDNDIPDYVMAFEKKQSEKKRKSEHESRNNEIIRGKLDEKQHLENKDGVEVPATKKLNTNSRSGQFPFNVLLLSSMGRSGSSFVGALIRSQKQVFYIFEPLHHMEAENTLTNLTAIAGLKGIFTCDIKDHIMSHLQKLPSFFIREYYKECRKWWWGSCLSADSINAGCKKKSVVVAKTIRTRVSWLQSILDDDKVNMKVIHLIRDPRPSLISGWNLDWGIKPEVACQHVSEDVKSGVELTQKYPERYMAVRYEDLCAKPWLLAEQIYSFLGYDTLPLSTVTFLKGSTSSGSSSDTFGIHRNSQKMQQKWRSEITEEQLIKIENICGSTITQLGFQLFHDIKTTRNLSVPLYDDNYSNNIFTYRVT